jgi:hypothetical protein
VGVIASIDSASVAAEPGAEVSSVVRIQNTGMVVDHILLDVLGDAKSWVTVEPAELNLLPGADASARLTFRPPRTATPRAGVVPFAVRVMSQEDPDGSAIEEGAVEVGAFVGVTTELVPRTAQGRRRGRFRLIVENKGNQPTNIAVSAADPDLFLEFRARPEIMLAEPGTATFVRLTATPRKRFFKGPNKSLPFQTLTQGNGFEPVTTSGAMLQQQVLPEWLLPAVGIALAAAAILVALWFTVLKPEVHSAATAAVAQAVAPLKSSAAKASQAAQAANQAAQRANAAAGPSSGAAGSGKKGAGAAGGSSSSTTAAAAAAAAAAADGTPVSVLLQSNAAPTTPAKFSTVTYKMPAKDTLDVSDLVLENPAGDTGTMQIRSGTTTLFEFGMANFRSIDYHFVQSLIFTSAHPLVLAVQCQNTGKTHCTAGFSFSGTLHKPPAPHKGKPKSTKHT